MGLRIPLAVEMDDGRELKANCDQRDFARAEAEEIDPAAQRNTWVRFLAWSALSRTKQYGGTWQQFNETDCVEALVQEESTDAEGLDPGLKAPADAT